MRLEVRCTQDMIDLYSPDLKGIGDQRSMASPGQGFGAHQSSPLLSRKLDELTQVVLKVRGSHVISETSEGGVAPADILRARSWVAKPSKTRQMEVLHPSGLETIRKRLSIKLGVMP